MYIANRNLPQLPPENLALKHFWQENEEAAHELEMITTKPGLYQLTLGSEVFHR